MYTLPTYHSFWRISWFQFQTRVWGAYYRGGYVGVELGPWTIQFRIRGN